MKSHGGSVASQSQGGGVLGHQISPCPRGGLYLSSTWYRFVRIQQRLIRTVSRG